MTPPDQGATKPENVLLPRDSAMFSPCGEHRWLLSRDLGDDRRRVCFVMLNPSTATESVDDPTIRRCIGFALKWRYGWLDVVNLFSYRTSEPAVLLRSPDRTDYQLHNLVRVVQTAKHAQLVVGAWGSLVNQRLRDRRDEVVAALLEQGVAIDCIGTTLDGNPRHPLYVRGEERPRPWLTNAGAGEDMDPTEQVERFNESVPLGSLVTVRRDNGTIKVTKTRSLAHVLPSGHAVVWLKGIAGAYALERVKRIEEDTNGE